MKKLNIYIDYAGADEKIFSENLKSRLKNIDGTGSVLTYSDLEVEKVQVGEDEFDEDWESATKEAIEESDITITVLSDFYLEFLSQGIESRFTKIIDSKNKYFFPILYTPSEWGSYNWIVKSKLFPLDGIALTEHSEKDSANVISEFIKTIKNIILNHNIKVKDSLPIKDSKIIFISHDHEDADFAELLKLKLEKHSIDSWIDSERLKIGQDWRQEIDDGIQNSIAVIAIMTPNARKSEYVTYEWAFAWGKSIKVYPIMLKQTQLHPRLESLQYLDFTNRTSRPWDQLINSIKDLID